MIVELIRECEQAEEEVHSAAATKEVEDQLSRAKKELAEKVREVQSLREQIEQRNAVLDLPITYFQSKGDMYASLGRAPSEVSIFQ